MRGDVLALDAAAGPGTIALLRDGAVVAECTVEMRSAAEERFFPAVLALLAEAGGAVPTLRAVIAGAGPGSFTALRVVGAVAKGLAEGTGCPMYGVPSLALTAAARPGRTPRALSVLDALREESYAALVEQDPAGLVVRVESLGLVPNGELAARARTLGAELLGPEQPGGAAPHARGVTRLLTLVEAQGPVDLATWEPAYGRLAEAQVKWELAHGRPLVADRLAT